MNPTAAALLATLAAYLIGSLPFGFLTARLVAGIDIRKAGSGNIGATNVARVLGAKWGALVLVLDLLKGLLPVLLLPYAVLSADHPDFLHVQVGCGLATIVGHMFPCWLGFRGGKGVATALGVILVLAWQATVVAFATFAVTFLIWRIVSLSSMLAAVAFAAAQMWLLLPAPFAGRTWSLAAFSLLVPALILYRHRSNFVRLLRGQEPRFEPRRS
jgi:glycerol-3-phosphate acyltransferase PlsY